jgi:hypothetical protein
MALSDLIRSGFAIADSATAGMQATVTHKTVVSKDAYGKPTWAAGVTMQAVVTVAPRFLGPSATDGSAIVADAALVILRPLTVTMEDAFTLPSGETLKVLRSTALLDPDGAPYGVTVYVGR